MAIGWLSVLKMVPWGEVISNAPKVADGAKRLWSTVSGKPRAADSPAASAQPAVPPEAQSMATLQAQLAAAETEIAELHNQMLESSQLIKALADQNTLLIERFEVNRVRVLWLAWAVGILGIVAAIILAITFVP